MPVFTLTECERDIIGQLMFRLEATTFRTPYPGALEYLIWSRKRRADWRLPARTSPLRSRSRAATARLQTDSAERQSSRPLWLRVYLKCSAPKLLASFSRRAPRSGSCDSP